MKFRYLCSYHAGLMQYNEEEALRYWTETLRRGVAAFDQCRWDAARSYLGMAHEIALLRCAVPCNRYFQTQHVLRPLERLMDMALSENSCETASQLIDVTGMAMDNASADWRCALRDVLEHYRRRIHMTTALNAGWEIPEESVCLSFNTPSRSLQ